MLVELFMNAGHYFIQLELVYNAGHQFTIVKKLCYRFIIYLSKRIIQSHDF
jgi:hypothetical protein